MEESFKGRGTRAGSNTARMNAAGTGPDTEMDEVEQGREWDSEAFDRIDERDAENIDLDIECVNEALERKSTRT